MRRYGKLNSTHPGKLPQPQIVHCGCRNARDELHSISHIRERERESYLKKIFAAAIHKVDHYILWIAARGLRLVHCGGAAVGIEVPQYKSFYTVPYFRPCSHVHDWTRGPWTPKVVSTIILFVSFCSFSYSGPYSDQIKLYS